MWGKGHRLVTKKAIGIFREVVDGIDDGDTDFIANEVAGACVQVDHMRDLEFVDVDWGRDDPHEDATWEDSDEAHYTESEKNLTAFNHFIDIKKGRGLFDDYDGYSYEKGSASEDQYQDASDALEVKDMYTFFGKIYARISGDKIDEGLKKWLNDEYVHAPCHPWYRNCSPSIERYSFPEEKGIYGSVVDELKARFPMAEYTGEPNKGIPFSVFMPVDNLARWWYSRFLESRCILALGPVFHAVQDASIPHHVAGYMGNWHTEYEKDLDSNINNWLEDPSFEEEVKNLVERWNREDSSPPNVLNKTDWDSIPAKNWRIDRLVTWVALNAYREYDSTYHHFSNGYTFNGSSMRNLAKIAVAMSVLVLIKANEEAEGNVFNYVGNKELLNRARGKVF